MTIGQVRIVDPIQLFRDGLEEILRGAALEVVWKGDDVVAALEAAGDSLSLLIWTADELQENDIALAALKKARRERPSLRLIVLLPTVSRERMLQLVALDPDALLSKDISGSVLARSIELVLLGQQVVPQSIIRVLWADREGGRTEAAPLPSALPVPRARSAADVVIVNSPQPDAILVHSVREAPPPGAAADISERERQVLRHLIDGSSNKLIARHLSISEATVKVHVKTLLRKVNVSNRTQAAIWGLHNLNGGAHGATTP